MPQPRWLVAAAVAAAVTAVVAVVLLVATFGRGTPTGVSGASPGLSAPAGTTEPTGTATSVAVTPTAAPSPSADAPIATVAPTPTTAPATAPPRATGPPLLAWAEFLAHLNEARSTVEGLNSALTVAAQAQDADAVRDASVDILDFVDLERDWLRDHPPADCYAEAHGAAAAMLDAYGTAAERFIDWTTTGGGLGGLPALGVAVDAAESARAAFTTFVAALEGTTCPT
jgi:hypothetical protein